jgi:hypothetical protein
MDESKFLPRTIRKATFDQLYGSLQRRKRRDQQMKMIWHNRKFVEQIFSLLSIVEENVNEQLGHSIRLQNASLLECRSRNEVTSVSGGAAKWCGHDAPRRLKAAQSVVSLSQR